MSKTSDFAHAFASNLPIPGIEWTVKGKSATIIINNDDIHIDLKIALNITKNTNKAEIWHDSHFIGRCSGDNQVDLSDKLTKAVIKEIETRSEKQALRGVNRELCDYLTGKFKKHGFTIVNKAGNELYGSYIVQGPSGDKYQIKATYQDSQVKVERVSDNRDFNRVVKTFNLSNPKIEEVICETLLEYDKEELSNNQKQELKEKIQKLIIEGIYIDECEDDWDVSADDDLVICINGKHEIKFRVTDIILEEIKARS